MLNQKNIVKEYIENPQEFFEAKENVLWSLKHLDSGSIDMKGLEYWAGEVVRLHKIIKTNLNQ